MEDLTTDETLAISGGKKDPLKSLLHDVNHLHIKTDGNVAVSINIADVTASANLSGGADIIQIADSAAGTTSVAI
jgi:hypothetical protein